MGHGVLPEDEGHQAVRSAAVVRVREAERGYEQSLVGADAPDTGGRQQRCHDQGRQRGARPRTRPSKGFPGRRADWESHRAHSSPSAMSPSTVAHERPGKHAPTGGNALHPGGETHAVRGVGEAALSALPQRDGEDQVGALGGGGLADLAGGRTSGRTDGWADWWTGGVRRPAHHHPPSPFLVTPPVPPLGQVGRRQGPRSTRTPRRRRPGVSSVMCVDRGVVSGGP